MNNYRRAKTECLLKGKQVVYKACSTREDLEAAKKYYPNFNYIGSGKVYFIDGVRNDSEVLHHFFN